MIIGAVRDRLRDQVALLESVETTAELAAVVAGARRHRLPAALVHPVGDHAGVNGLINGVSQRLTVRIGVLIVIGAAGQDRDAGAPDALEPIYRAVRAALVGWEPGAEHEPITLARGAMVRVAEGTAWWLEEYLSAEHLRSV